MKGKKKHTKETRIKMREAHKGKKLSDETKRKIGLKMKGRKITWGAKITKTKLGFKYSEESKKKMSNSHLGQIAWNKGLKGYRAGVKHPWMAKKENHWNWKGGISKNSYPVEFNRKLKLKIRIRDNYTCCLCGKTEREELEDFNRVLCVNHIDFNKCNIKESNLNTLCLKCNTKINRERDYWTNYFQNL